MVNIAAFQTSFTCLPFLKYLQIVPSAYLALLLLSLERETNLKFSFKHDREKGTLNGYYMPISILLFHYQKKKKRPFEVGIISIFQLNKQGHSVAKKFS